MGLIDDIKACTRCELSSGRKKAVPLHGTGPVVIVGEAPGAEEDNFGIPFVGPAGQLLNEALTQAGLPRSQVATMNTICCRPQDNMYAHAEDAGAPAACRPWFQAQLEASGAWLVVLTGAIPFRIVTTDQRLRGGNPPKGDISKVRGTPWWFEGRLWIPTFHPSYALRSGGLDSPPGRHLLADLAYVRRLADAEVRIAPDDWGNLSPMSGERATSIPATVYSNILGERITVVNTLDQEPDTPYPVWTVMELVRIRAAGPAFSLDDLLRVATIKRGMRAEIVR